MDLIIRNEVELWLHRIRAKDGAFGFVLGAHLGQRFLRALFVGNYDVPIVEWTTTGLGQRSQLTVYVGTKQVENDLRKGGIDENLSDKRNRRYAYG